jgi:hypothetical protein
MDSFLTAPIYFDILSNTLYCPFPHFLCGIRVLTRVFRLEIQKGIEQISKALEFLHDNAGLVHGNLTPDAVFVNAKVWQLVDVG